MTNCWNGKVALICSDCKQYQAFATVEDLTAHQKLFHPTFSEQYELALKQGDKRFGSECKHEHIKNGRCQDCLRKVVSK